MLCLLPMCCRPVLMLAFRPSLNRVCARRYADLSPADGLRLLLSRHLVPLYALVQEQMGKTGESVAPLTGAFARLYDVKSYTGVYKERFASGDGRINGDADNRTGRDFKGNTNSGTDETIHDISVLMRPNLRSTGGTMSPRCATAAAAAGAAAAAQYAACVDVSSDACVRETSILSCFSCVGAVFARVCVRACVTTHGAHTHATLGAQTVEHARRVPDAVARGPRREPR